MFLKTFHILLLTLIILSLSLTASPLALGQDNSRQLDKLRLEIKSLSKSLRDQFALKNTLGTELETMEKEIQSLFQQHNALAADLDHSLQSFDTLQTDVDRLSLQLPELRHKLYLLAVARQRFQRKSRLQIVLDLDRPEDLQRTLMFFDYISLDSVQELKSAHAQLKQTRAKKELVRTETLRLVELQQRLGLKQHELEVAKLARSDRLDEVNQQIRLKNQHLSEKQSEREQLELLVTGLKEVKHLKVTSATNHAPSTSSHHTLPLDGKVLRSFRQKDDVTGIKATGMIIAADASTDVRSISGGQVVFSDWFRGFGLLLVIDHGNNVMSLYGFLSELLLKVGDSVERGELIAKVGNTGGQSQNSLYFEVRRDGNPINPAQFISRQNS